MKVSAAADKAVKVLNALVQKAKSVEERRAIDDEILILSKVGLSEAKSASPWVGTYRWSNASTVTIRAGLTAMASDGSTAIGKFDGHRLTLE